MIHSIPTKDPFESLNKKRVVGVVGMRAGAQGPDKMQPSRVAPRTHWWTRKPNNASFPNNQIDQQSVDAI